MKLLILIKSLFLDKNELKFIKTLKNFNKFKDFKKNNVLLIIPNDHYYLCYNYIIFKERLSKFNVYGYWPYFMHLNNKNKYSIVEKFHEFKSYIYFKLLKKKFSKLYRPLSLKKFYDFDSICKKYSSKKDLVEANKKSNKIFKNLKKKEDVLNLKINNIYCGDLIYDTYIRFRNHPTVDIKDLYLKKIIFKSILLILSVKKLQSEMKFKYLYTSYATYNFYGIMVRTLLEEGVEVYSGATIAQYNKKLTRKDFLHVENYKKFPTIFKKLDYKSKKIEESKKFVNKIFYGNRKNLQIMDYMNVNPFEKNQIKLNKKYDGIIFLPNFFESQREWGKLVFSDFYDWIIFTCNLIEKNNLNIAIKAHPNIFYVNTESVKIVNELKLRFNKIDWIDPSISNFELFKNIKFGVSPWGTILWELAYFNIHPISAGDHPACKYKIGFEPRTVKQYKNILLSAHKLKKKRDISKKILEYCYMYYIYNHDYYKTLAREIKLNEMKFTKSQTLLEYIKKIKSYEKKL